MGTNDPRMPGAPSSLSPRNGNGRKTEGSNLSPSSKRAGKQPSLREPIDSIVSETSFVTNPYAAGGPVGTPSPGPPLNAPPGLNPIPIPQPSSFILPPLNFVPLASGYFATATSYATQYLPGSHPLRLSVALEHSAFLWDCVHDHDGSRRVARRAIKDVYRAQEAMDDTEFEDAAELVGILGRMMKRKSWEGTPRVGMTSPTLAAEGPEPDSGGPMAAPQLPSQGSRRAADGPPLPTSSAQTSPGGVVRSRATSASKSAARHKESRSHENTPRADTQRFAPSSSQETTPRARHASLESGASSTPKATQGVSGRSPTTSSSVRNTHRTTGSNGSAKGASAVGTPVSPSAAATFASDTVRHSPTLRHSPVLRHSPNLRRLSPPQENKR